MGDVAKPIKAQSKPRMPQTNCFFIIAIMPIMTASGTNTGDKIKMLINPKMNDAIPSALLLLLLMMMVFVVALCSELFFSSDTFPPIYTALSNWIIFNHRPCLLL